MGSYTRFKLLLGSIGFIFVIKLIIHQHITAQERESNHELKDQRKQPISAMCDSDNEEVKSSNLRHLFVDDEKGVIYCYVPLVTEVVTTNWTAFHNPSKLSMLNGLPEIKMQAKLKEYTKFLFVQDPFVRLISAYREAFLQQDDYYYQNFGLEILHRYSNQSNPPHTAKRAFAAGVRPSFYNFIEYLTDPETKRPFAPIWRPMYQLCHPCFIEYDFVGHLETLREDVKQLLDILKQDSGLPRVYRRTTPSDSAADWFRAVPAETGRKLYELYEMDFKLFGYPRPVGLLDG